MMKHTHILLLTILILFSKIQLEAQYFQDKSLMYFSDGFGLDFNNLDPANSNGQYPHFNLGGSICQLDGNGNMLFYTAQQNPNSNQFQILDSAHQPLTDELGASVDLSPILKRGKQKGVSVPSPNGNTYNMIVHAGCPACFQPSAFPEYAGLYRIVIKVVDGIPSIASTPIAITAPPNLGFSTVEGKAVRVYENLAVIPHSCNNNIFWILATTLPNAATNTPSKNVVFQLEYTTNNPNGEVTYIGSVDVQANTLYAGSTINVSPSGEDVVIGNIVYSFDREIGQLTYVTEIMDGIIPSIAYEAALFGAFSPSSQYFYNILPYSDDNPNVHGDVYRWDATNNWSGQHVGYLQNENIGNDLMLGPDGKIHIFGNTTFASTPAEYFYSQINTPDAPLPSDIGLLEGNNVIYFNNTVSDLNSIFPNYIEAAIPATDCSDCEIGFTVTEGKECGEYTIVANECVTDFKWAFGDGYSISNGLSEETYFYTAPGIYEIELTTTTNGITEYSYQTVVVPDCFGEEECELTDLDPDEEGWYVGNSYQIINESSLYINQAIEVPAGLDLVIDNSNLYFGPNGSIKVVDGRIRIQNNSLLTRHSCNKDLWPGLIGENSRIRIFDSTISYAETAVDVNNNDNENYSFEIRNSIFKNSNITISINSNVGNIYTSCNLLSIKGNVFESNDDDGMNVFLKLNKLNLNSEENSNNYITGNIFLVTNNTILSNLQGIHVKNFIGNPLFIGQQSSGNFYNNNIFVGLRNGITLVNTEANSSDFEAVEIENNQFVNVNAAIYSRYTKDLTVFDNTMTNMGASGINLLNAGSYIISENSITSTSPALNNGKGIKIRYNPSTTEGVFIINDNDIVGFKRGIMFQDYQDDSFDIDFTCNRIIDNKIGLALLSNSDLQTLTSESLPSNNAFDNVAFDISVSPNSTLGNFYYYTCSNLCDWFKPDPVEGNVFIDAIEGEPGCNLMEMRMASIEEETIASFTVQPNPNRGVFDIILDENLLSENDLTISVFNSQGMRIDEIRNAKTLGKNVSMDLTQYPTGVYMIQLNTGTINITEKVVITK